MSLRSMTGFGAGQALVGDRELRVELRAVNHRFLDTRVRLPTALQALTGVVEELLKARCERGRVEAYVSYATERSGPALDLGRAESALRTLVALRDQACPGEALPVALLTSMPGLFVEQEAPDVEGVRVALVNATEQACDALAQARGVEGAALQADLETLLADVDVLLTAIEAERPALLRRYEQRLKERLKRALQDERISLDPARLVTEVAIFVDRSDVAEELARLRAHLAHFLATLTGGGAVGRKLDFLTQEIFREANTLGTKTPDVTITHQIVELKTTLERIREQVQNAL
ncbi:MAG: YicC family protein [Myxococcales bacterium]|nr:YicC family protein [Myxococcales bacterium]